jgi:tripeptidyl-peptidase I
MHSLFPVVLLGLGFLATSPVAAAPREYSIKEEISSPRGWVKHSQPHPDHNIILRIGLPQPNFHVLEKNLYEVSDPAQERYGQHLSKSEVEALVAPHPESLNSVNEWLGSFGFDEDSLVRSPAKDWVTLKVPVSLAEKMLDTVSFLNLASLVPVLQLPIHFCRPITSGSILIAVITWFGLQVMVFLAIFMITSTSFNPRRCS